MSAPPEQPDPPQRASLLDALRMLREAAPDEHHGPTVREALNMLHGRGLALILLFLSIPFCFPIPLIGLSTPFGIAILLLSLRVIFNQKPWLPDFLMRQRLSPKFLDLLIHHATPGLKRLEKLVHPRWEMLAVHRTAHIVHGLFIFIMAALLLLPIPIPFTNILPALPVVLICLGMMERDGALIGAGYLVGFFAMGVFAALFEVIRRVILTTIDSWAWWN